VESAQEGPKIIAIANRKGGCGKTTSCVNLAYALAEEGYKVLLIDLDPQANATSALAHGLKKYKLTVREFLAGKLDDKKISYKEVVLERGNTLKVLPAKDNLANMEDLFAVAKHTKGINPNVYLRQRIKQIDDKFDFILIDCPPGEGYLLKNALVAAHGVIIPGNPDIAAIEGGMKIMKIIDDEIRSQNPHLKMLGFLVVDYGSRFIIDRFFLGHLERQFSGRILKTKIRHDKKVAEAYSQGMSLFEYKRYSNAAQDYEALAKEIIDIHGMNGKGK
jgi:chromosome partitioning protein